uniref:Glycine zipper domain-containing protein n=1 Tax=Meloidogyne javanica TaxID=6303 RepID=A0A915LQN4_MELJA
MSVYDGQLENLRAYKEINDRLCNVENKTNEQDEIISLQEQRLINLEEQEKKLKNKQKKKSSWFNSLKNFVGNVIGTVGKIYENVTTPNIEHPKVEEVIVDEKENLIPEEKEDLAEEFTKIENGLTSKNVINEFNKIEIFFEEKGEKLQNFREVNNFGEVNNKEKKEIINLTTIPNNLINQNNREVLGNLADNNGKSSSNSDNNGGDGDPKNESKIRDLKEPVNNQNNGEVLGNLSNNNGQSSSPNSDNNGGDGDPKKEEYESQIKDLQETITRKDRENSQHRFVINELRKRVSVQEHKVLEKEEIIKQNQEKIEKREEEIAKLQREKNSAEEKKNAIEELKNNIEEQKKKLEELNNKLEEGKNKSEKGETLGKIVGEAAAGATAGAVIGGLFGGLVGAAVGGVAGAVIGGVVGGVKRFFGDVGNEEVVVSNTGADNF